MHPVLEIGLRNAGMATLLALFAAAIGSMCRRPAIKHSLWLLVLLKLVTPPIVGVPVPWFTGLYPSVDNKPVIPGKPLAALEGPLPLWDRDVGDENVVLDDQRNSAALAEMGPVPGTEPELPLATEPEGQIPRPGLDRPEPALLNNALAIPWIWIITLVWLAGSACWFALTTIRIHQFQRSLRYATPAPAALATRARELAGRLGLVYCPTIWLVPGRISPLVWTLGGKKRLFIPTGLWERLNEEQRATLLAHELAHLLRRDHWVRGLELLATSLYWWHPIVWWACRELREAEEQCCDAWVVWAFPDSARAYATALVETVDFLSESEIAVPAVASGFGHVHDLRRRLTMIMRGTTPRALSSVGLLAVLGLAAFLLPMLPTQAQPPGPVGADPRSAEEQERGAAERATLVLQEVQERTRERALAQRREREANITQDEGRGDEESRRLSEEIRRMQEQLRAATQRLHQIQEEDMARRREHASRDTAPEGVMRGQDRPTTRSSGSSDQDRRLRDVERKLDTVLEEIRSLRRELRQPRRGPAGGGGGMGGGPSGLGLPGAPTQPVPPLPVDPSVVPPPSIASAPTAPALVPPTATLPSIPQAPSVEPPASGIRRPPVPASPASPRPKRPPQPPKDDDGGQG